MFDKFFQMGIQENGSQEEQNVYVIKSFIEDIFNNHDLSAVKKYFKNATLSEKGNAIFKKTLEAFPDIHAKIEHIISKNDQVVVFINFKGTHKGHFKGITPTNRQVEIRSADLYKLENERIVDHWDVVDESDLLVKG